VLDGRCTKLPTMPRVSPTVTIDTTIPTNQYTRTRSGCCLTCVSRELYGIASMKARRSHSGMHNTTHTMRKGTFKEAIMSDTPIAQCAGVSFCLRRAEQINRTHQKYEGRAEEYDGPWTGVDMRLNTNAEKEHRSG